MRIVSVTSSAPYDGIPHAGGQYVQKLCNVLRSMPHVSLHVYAPESPMNLHAIANNVEEDRPHLLKGRESIALSFLGRAVSAKARQLAFVMSKVVGDQRLWSAIKNDDALHDDLEHADVVDLQWESMARLAPLVRRYSPRARIIATFHDVDSQRWMRKCERSSGFRRFLLRAAGCYVRRAERRCANDIDTCVVFSIKDRILLEEAGVAPGKIVVVDPPIEFPKRDCNRRQVTSGCVLFVGWMLRPENVDAIKWLLQEVWPLVVDKVPFATLRIVGKDVSRDIVDLASRDGSVEIIGYVDDLASEYEKAALSVIPLRDGAGVKFKAIESLISAVPTVATSVGAEGIGGDDIFWKVTDESDEFAAAMIEALLTDRAQDDALAVAGDIRKRFSLSRFQERVSNLYVPRH
nr:glycosyltransferase [Actinomyces sp.]